MIGTMGRRRKEPDTSMYSGRLAARIRQLREEKFDLQEDFAAAVGRPVSVISAWETGRRQPRFNDLPAIASALGKSIRQILPAD